MEGDDGGSVVLEKQISARSAGDYFSSGRDRGLHVYVAVGLHFHGGEGLVC